MTMVSPVIVDSLYCGLKAELFPAVISRQAGSLPSRATEPPRIDATYREKAQQHRDQRKVITFSPTLCYPGSHLPGRGGGHRVIPPGDRGVIRPRERGVTPPGERAVTPPGEREVTPPGERGGHRVIPPGDRGVIRPRERAVTPLGERGSSAGVP
ncbi:unnamed protein product [Arctogadus glacialis]